MRKLNCFPLIFNQEFSDYPHIKIYPNDMGDTTDVEDYNESDNESENTISCPVPITVNYINIGHVNTLNHGQTDTQNDSTGYPVVQRIFRGGVRKYIQRIWRDSIQDVSYPSSEVLDIEDYTKSLRRKLKKFYRDVTLPCVFWSSEEDDYMLSDHYCQLQLREDSLPVRLDDVFNKVSGSRPTRILVEGQAGYGKTTLATKIAFDWATKQKYLRKFRLAFLLPLNELRGRSVQTAIEAIAGHCGFSRVHHVLAVLDDNLSKTLLILDGLDEIPEQDRTDILRILFKQVYDEITVVVTCRTGLFKVDHSELCELYGGVSKKRKFHDKLITILGISFDHSEKFLRKFVNHKKCEIIVKYLTKEVAFTKDKFKSPMFLIFMSLLTEEKEINQMSLKPLLQMRKNSRTMCSGFSM